LYSVIVLQKAQRVIEELDGSLDGLEIDEIVSSLADNPDREDAWTPDGEPQTKFGYVGENRKRMIAYEINEAGLVVYVHSIERRPSANLDPR
jgi:hypothetical protein